MIRAAVATQDLSNNFSITFSDHSGYDVVVQRTLEDFKSLNQKLTAAEFALSGAEPLFPAGDNVVSAQLQDYLNFWLGYYNESSLVTDALVGFMEDAPGQSVVTQLQFNVLREKISRLTAQNRQYEMTLSDMAQKSAELSEMVTLLQSKLNGSSSSLDEEQLGRSAASRSADGTDSLRELVPTRPLTPISSEPNGKAALAAALQVTIPLVPEPFLVEASAVDDETPRPLSNSSRNATATPAEIRHTAEQLLVVVPDLQQVRRFEEGVQEILSSIQPHPSQVIYRASVTALIKRQVRQVLRVNAFECGLHVLRCFLPDDTTRLTVILGRSRVAQWHKTLHDRLIQVTEMPELGRADRPLDDDYAVDQDDEHPAFDHVLSKVQVASEDANFKVDCIVDTTEASISCNRRGDICLLAFFEEFAALVGQDDLFKRSLLLIRAWWFYETSAYGHPIRHYIPDGAMCIMVCAIFNQFHSRISSPLQALCLFLAEYSAYDGATQAITLQGVVSFPEGSQLSLIEPQETHLVSAAIMDKYWVLFNIQEASASAVHFNQSQQITDELNDDLSRGTFLSKGHKPSFQSFFHGGGNASQRAYTHGVSRFERSGFNVANPFVNTNMVERLVNRRLQRVQRAFAVGAACCLSVFNRGSGEESLAIRALFPVVHNRFGQGFVRPDKVGDNSPLSRHNSNQYSTGELMHVNVERLMNHILYCNFVLESVLSDAALLVLCTEILKEKKVQPVGEVGKMLAEITSSPNLSAKLKEKFGGLKKFLEFFSGRFIFSNDHPFNPSVTLRSILDHMNLEPTDKGVQNLTNIHKARKSGSKRTSPMPSPDTSYGSIPALSSPYYSQQGTPNGSTSTARSMATFTLSPPGSAANFSGGLRPDTFNGYGGNTAIDARRKINAYGQGTEQLWIAEQNRPRVAGTAVGPAIAEYSPRQSIQRAQMGNLGGLQQQQQQQQPQNRTYPSSQQGHQQPPMDPQFSQMQRNARQQQQQQQPQLSQQVPPQYAPSPQMYNPGQQARPYGGRPLQQMPPQGPPMQGMQNGPFPTNNNNNNNAAFGGRGSSAMPLYARQGPSTNNPNLSQHTSPQNQQREMDALRYLPQDPSHNNNNNGAMRHGSNPSGAGGPLYQRSPMSGLNGSLHGPADDVSDLFRDINLNFSLSDFNHHSDSLLSVNTTREATPSIPGLTGAPFSGTISRPSSAAPNSSAKIDEEQWF